MKKILLTGANGYIGKRLLPLLVKEGHFVYCCVRDKQRHIIPDYLQDSSEVVEVDFLKEETLKNIPKDVDAAYYLIHSMSGNKEYSELEYKCSENFKNYLSDTKVEHVIFLTGIVNNDKLSDHLESRKRVEDNLAKGSYNFTALRAGIIIGSGSASFEIIRDLVEKLPVMIAPKWLNTRCQPIAIADVLQFLLRSLFKSFTYNQNFDIGGQDVLTYKEMLLGFADSRGLNRFIATVPIMTPRLSSYWLYFVTSTTYRLAQALVDSMKIEVVARPNDLSEKLGIDTLSYKDSLERTFKKIEQNEVISSWKDSFISGRYNFPLSDFIKVPEFGCFKDVQKMRIKDQTNTLDKIWRIGGANGWYYATFLWKIRGYLDKLIGGIGLRRGRTHPENIEPGDALDFWRVLYANKSEGRLLLYAEMKLPGDAWLEFKVEEGHLVQTASFRPKGVMGRLYWYSVVPFHLFVFKGMAKKIAE